MALALAVGLAVLATACSGPLSGADKPVRGLGHMMDHAGAMAGMMGGGTDTSSSAPTQGGIEASVSIRDFRFDPGNLRVPVGAKITWTNFDEAPHTATARNGRWDTGILNKGGSAVLTFAEAGEYPYYCAVHPDMKAVIVVE